MPRSPTTYVLPPGTTPQAPNTTIGSAMFNAAMDDIATTFNTAQPIAFGGTGATSVITGWDALNAIGADIATSGTINLTTATGPNLTLTGTTTVTAVTLGEGNMRFVRANAVFQLTASANLIVNGSASSSYTTVAGDLLVFIGGAAGVVRVWAISGAVQAASLAEVLAGVVANKYVSPATAYFSPGTLYGMTLSNNVADATNDIDFTTGSCRDSSDTQNILQPASFTKRLDANWAAGTNQGMRYSGAAITNTTYHIYAVAKALGADPDYYADPSATASTVLGHLQAETGGADYLYVRRIGSIVRTGAAIKGFVQDGDYFTWKVPVGDISAANPGTSAVTRTLTLPVGIRVKASLGVGSTATAANTDFAGAILITDLSTTDTAPTNAIYNAANFINSGIGTIIGSAVDVWTNTSAQVRSRIANSAAGTTFVLTTLGYLDPRGRT